MDVDIRPCRPSDRQAVLALAPRLRIGVAPWRDTDAVAMAVEGWIESAFADDAEGLALVAEVDAEVVGFVSLSTTGHFAGETDAYIGELMVAESHAGRGVGRALVAAVEAAAVDRGYHCITLHTGAANTAAIAFYERLGYSAEDVKLTKVLRENL